MKTFSHLLVEFNQTLKTSNYLNYSKLEDPIEKSEMLRIFKYLKVNDLDLITLYQWKNGFGASNNKSCQIFDYGYLLSLPSILNIITERKGIAWVDSFIPLFTNGAGDFLLFNNTTGEGYGKLHLYSVSLLYIETPISYYDSLYAMMATTIRAYKLHALKYDPKEDWLDLDYELFPSIAKDFNRHSDYWKQL